jgi:hypothetical protein
MPPEHCCFEFLIGSLLRLTQNPAEAIVADRKVLKCVKNPQIQPILEYLCQPILPYGSIARISKDTGIPKQTLSEWSHHRRDPTTPNWFPLEAGRPHKRALALEVEQSLAEHIRNNWIKTGKGAVLEYLPW